MQARPPEPATEKEEKKYPLKNDRKNENPFFYKQTTIFPRKIGEVSRNIIKSITWEELCNQSDGREIAVNLIADSFLQRLGPQEHYQWVNEWLVQSGFSENCTVETVNWTPEQLNQIAMTRIPPYNASLLTHLIEEINEAMQKQENPGIQPEKDLIKQINEKIIKHLTTENINHYLTHEEIDGESGLLYATRFGRPEILAAMIEKVEDLDRILHNSCVKNFSHIFLVILRRVQNEKTLSLWQPVIESMVKKISDKELHKWLMELDENTLNSQFHILLNFMPALLSCIVQRLSPEVCQILLAWQNQHGRTSLEMAARYVDDDTLLAVLIKQANNAEFIEKLIKQTDKKFAVRLEKCFQLSKVYEVNVSDSAQQLANRSITESKPRDKLLAEYKEMNQENGMDVILLGNQLDAISQALYSSSELVLNGREIAEWNAADIQNWAEVYKKNSVIDKNQDEVVAVIMRGVELIWSYRPRDTQIMALCTLLYEDINSKGTLGEIQTGEGKSLIVAMQSLFLALQGRKVDVFINSSVLAMRDCHEMQPLYNLFGISAAANCDPNKFCCNSEYDSVYDSDIVYGDVRFQHDYLREKRGNRPYNCVIVDEVDNLFIDGLNHTAILSDNTPGTEHLRILQVAIWHRLHKLHSAWHANHEQSPNDDLVEKMRAALRVYLHKLIHENIAGFSFPKHLSNYIEARKDDWVDGAIDAMYHYKENHHYVISSSTLGKHSVAPVLHSSTGIVLPNNVWFAVHPFLELKHGLRMSSDTMHMSFVSNPGYFQFYQKITGVTGTPGNNAEQTFLRKLYSVSCVRIPAFTPSKFEELPGRLSTDWLNDVVTTALQVAASGRPVLVLCETIVKAEAINQTINSYLGVSVSNSYTRNDTAERKVTETVVGPGVIIPTTLLGTRGMNLQTSAEAEQNGGLFVLFSFLPENARVQRQGFGRTARNGKNGSGQLIADRDETILSLTRKYPEFKKENACDYSLAEIYQWRDMANQKKLRKNIEFDARHIALRDSLYVAFTSFMREKMHEANHARKTAGSIYEWTNIDNAFPAENPIDPMRVQARFAFGLWLNQLDKKIQQDNSIDETAAWQGFSQLQAQINLIYQHPIFMEIGDQIINSTLNNPGPLIVQSLHGPWHHPMARILLLKKCLELDPVYSAQAHYNLAFSLFSIGLNGLRHLQVARELLTEKIIPTYQAMLLFDMNMAAPKHHKKYGEFSENLQNTIRLLCLQVKEIDLHLSAIHRIVRSGETWIKVESENKLFERIKNIGLSERDYSDFLMSGMLSFHTTREYLTKKHNENKFFKDIWHESILLREIKLPIEEFSSVSPIAGLFNYEKSVQMVSLATQAGNVIQHEHKPYLAEEKESFSSNINDMGSQKRYVDIVIAQKHFRQLKKLKNEWLTEARLVALAEDLRKKFKQYFGDLLNNGGYFPVLINLIKFDRTQPQFSQKFSDLMQLFLSSDCALSASQALLDGMVQQVQLEQPEFHLLETSVISSKLTKCANSVFTVFWSRLELLFGSSSGLGNDHPDLSEVSEWLETLLANNVTSRILEMLGHELLYPAAHLLLSEMIRSVADNLPTEMRAELMDQIQDSNTLSVQTDEYLRGSHIVQTGGIPTPLAGLSRYEAATCDIAARQDMPWRRILNSDYNSINMSFNHALSGFTAIAAGDAFPLFNIGHNHYSEAMLTNAASFGIHDGLKNAFSSISHTWQDINGTTRLAGGIQCVAGISSAIGGGAATATLPVAGQILGPFFATYGVDNAIAGCTALVTGIPQVTIMNGILQNGVGLSHNAAFAVELGLGVGEIAAAAPLLTGSLTTFSMFAKTLAHDAGQAAKFTIGARKW